MLFYLTFIIPIALFFFRRLWKNAKPVPKSVFTILLSLFIVSLGLWVATFYMAPNVYWRGFRSHCFLFLFMSLCCLFFYLLHPERYFRSWITITMTILMFCFSAMSYWVCLFTFDDFYGSVAYNDDKYRLEQFHGIMAMPRLPDLYVKKGLFETKYSITREEMNKVELFGYLDVHKITKTEVQELRDNKVSITFYHSDTAIKTNPLHFIIDIK